MAGKKPLTTIVSFDIFEQYVPGNSLTQLALGGEGEKKTGEEKERVGKCENKIYALYRSDILASVA